MKVILNWRLVLRHAWSVRLIVLAGLLSGLEATLPLFPMVLGVSSQALAGLTFMIVMTALVARFIAQQKVSGGDDA